MSVLEWIKNRYSYQEFDENKIQNIQQFSLVWNIFERECCECFAKINVHPEKIAVQIINKTLPNQQEVWNHFKRRYIRNNQITTKFESFVFQDNDKKEKVREILLSSNSSKQEQIEALLRIIFRLRNNLMHGQKNPSSFYDQDKNFKYANMFLMDICNEYRGEACQHLYD